MRLLAVLDVHILGFGISLYGLRAVRAAKHGFHYCVWKRYGSSRTDRFLGKFLHGYICTHCHVDVVGNRHVQSMAC
jgi:hypothetical protein